jgi:hypothetical protein
MARGGGDLTQRRKGDGIHQPRMTRTLPGWRSRPGARRCRFPPLGSSVCWQWRERGAAFMPLQRGAPDGIRTRHSKRGRIELAGRGPSFRRSFSTAWIRLRDQNNHRAWMFRQDKDAYTGRPPCAQRQAAARRSFGNRILAAYALCSASWLQRFSAISVNFSSAADSSSKVSWSRRAASSWFIFSAQARTVP